ncbi:hypothetical protein BCR35DRAFT_353654 [Leucosporidium creatinivorum]|uniref:Uncharacterized protein n=1 Tax=Leucosporidium creatinivorum TaxID=106004 RepID=A0A1Y2EUT3_9BASI|nr:hypothetical protein BCR35DRAFT_353654 [Leucosporidium creatinivorum]
MHFSLPFAALAAASVAYAAPQPVVERATTAPTFDQLKASCQSAGAIAAVSYKDYSSTTVSSGACLPYTNAAGSAIDQVVACKSANCALSYDNTCGSGIATITLPITVSYSQDNNVAQGTILSAGASSALCTA